MGWLVISTFNFPSGDLIKFCIYLHSIIAFSRHPEASEEPRK